jgi:peroxiredoxin
MSRSLGGLGRNRWKWLLAGVGLFAAGGVVGALVMLSLFLYRLPSESPAALDALVPPTSTLGTAAFSRSPALETRLPTPSTLPVGPAVGQIAPPFTLPALDGAHYALETFRGRTVLLHFWASWCRPCREDWPEWVAFGAAVTETVAILAVNVEEAPEAVREFVEQHPAPFPVLLDGEGAISELYRVTALPTTVLIDPQGIVQQVVPGSLGREALERLVAH